MRVCGSRGQNRRLLIIHPSPRQRSLLGPTAPSVTAIITHTRTLDGRPQPRERRPPSFHPPLVPPPPHINPPPPATTDISPSHLPPPLPHLGQSISAAKAQGDTGAVALVTIATQLLPGHRAQKQAPEPSRVFGGGGGGGKGTEK